MNAFEFVGICVFLYYAGCFFLGIVASNFPPKVRKSS